MEIIRWRDEGGGSHSGLRLEKVLPGKAFVTTAGHTRRRWSNARLAARQQDRDGHLLPVDFAERAEPAEVRPTVAAGSRLSHDVIFGQGLNPACRAVLNSAPHARLDIGDLVFDFQPA